MSALPIFPGRHQPSIFGASELNCRVRDGNGWTLTAISTDFVDVDFISFASAYGESSFIPSRLLSKSKPLRWVLTWFRTIITRSFSNQTRFAGLRLEPFGIRFLASLSISTASTVKTFSLPRSVPTPGGVVHLQGLEPWTP